MEMAENWFTIQQAVRFRDLDAMGHVNNATYFIYFEEARKELFGRYFGFTVPADFPFIIAAISCCFQRPVELEVSRVEVALGTSHLGRKSFTFKYRISRPGSPEMIFAKGESVQVYYDYAAGESTGMPADFRAGLERFLVA